MKIIKANLGKRSYDIIIGNDIIKSSGAYLKRLDIGQDAYVITNAFLKNRYANELSAGLKKKGYTIRYKVIPDTERSKSLAEAVSIIRDIASYDKKRRIFIVAFGGGVIGDLAGFIAAIYKRGIPFVQIPTTLLAQVDSAIGGKTGVDLDAGKNLVGAFYQPRLVLSDIKILDSLDLRQLRSGLAEIIKYAIIKDKALFSFLERRYRDIFDFKKEALEFVIERCAGIKVDIVSKDEREEKGQRTILNFGHTIGHALEAAADYKGHTHGEAIAIGMLAASEISQRIGILSQAALGRIKGLIENAGLPTRIRNISTERIINAHYRDKKFIGAKNRFVLIEAIGRPRIVKDIPLKIIKETLKKRSV